MSHLGCNPSLPAPRAHGGRVPRLTRRLAPVVAAVLVLAALGCREDATSPTSPREPNPPALATTAAEVLSFRQVSAGAYHTCGVTTDDRAYCWGSNFSGELGDGTNSGPETCFVQQHCSTRPVAVAGTRRFDHVNAGLYHTCGVTLAGRGFCWGANAVGQLGDGTTFRRLTPTALAVDLSLVQVSAGFFQSCGVTTSDRAYCWGSNAYGQLGDGTTTDRSTPTAVAGPM
jgi:alpha-tubulin suppressor-like RCC1 family protein